MKITQWKKNFPNEAQETSQTESRPPMAQQKRAAAKNYLSFLLPKTGKKKPCCCKGHPSHKGTVLWNIVTQIQFDLLQDTRQEIDRKKTTIQF